MADFDYEPVSRSEFEALFFDLCIEYELPRPTMNGRILGYEVDAHWPGTNLIVELDSYGFHSDRRAFEADRLRDSELVLAGYRVVRVTYRQLTRQPQAVARRLRTLLAYPPP